MQIRFLSKLSLFVAILALPQFITSNSTSQSILCSSALAADVKQFGEEGESRSSEPAEKGLSGRSSDSLTMFADGSPMTLDLSGGNGGTGEHGVNGYDAICDEPLEEVDKNLQGADGGDGGDAGDGGVGGNGGSLTVYATNKEHLKQIYVIATGGEGGPSGKPGNGGEGCKCDNSYLNQEICTGDPGSPDYKCTTAEFQCTDGYSGKKGRIGRKGRDGQLGNLTLINLDKSLAPDQPEVTVPISELKARGFTLSRNIWQNNTGASSLFAPGSIISDKYKELVARQEHSVLLVWDAPQPVDDFGDQQITLKLQAENDADIFLPDDLWLETTSMKRDNVTELFVFNAVEKKDVDDLTIDGVFGSGTDLELDVFDKAEKSDLIATEFSIKYLVGEPSEDKNIFGRSLEYKTKYEGKIPPEAIQRNGSLFRLQLGKLPISPEYLQLGAKIKVEVAAKRSLGENSKIQEMSTRTTIENAN